MLRSDLAKVNKNEARGVDWVVSSPAARYDAEPRVKNGALDFGPKNHCVVTDKQTFDAAGIKGSDEVVIVEAEECGVNLLKYLDFHR